MRRYGIKVPFVSEKPGANSTLWLVSLDSAANQRLMDWPKPILFDTLEDAREYALNSGWTNWSVEEYPE